MRLDKLLAETIIELIDTQTHKLLGAIQDGRVVLGGSAGSAGGVGDPPAGFWGQLRQANVTFDTAGSRPCASGSAGSDSLVDNLDRIRLGWDICDDAINEDHIDWGHGAGQVSAVDVPFQTTSGSIDATNVRDAIEETYAECYGSGGSAPLGDHDHSEAVTQGGDALNPATISPQTFVVGPDPCLYQTVGAAVAAAGAPTAANPATIKVMGIKTVETGAITLPHDCHVEGLGRGSVIGMGANALNMGIDTSLQDVVVPGSGSECVNVNGVTNVVLRNVKAVQSAAAYCFRFRGAATGGAHHCIAETTHSGAFGFYVEDTAVALLQDCIADDSTNFHTALGIDDTAECTTLHCRFHGATNDVWAAAGATWKHAATVADPDNVTMLGAGTALPQYGINLKNTVEEFSIDGTLSDNSDLAVPTEQAVKTYADTRFPSGAIILWDNSDVCPTGFTRVAGADNRYLQARSSGAGGTGGNASHSHTLVSADYPNYDYTLEGIVSASGWLFDSQAGVSTLPFHGPATTAAYNDPLFYRVLV